MVLNVLKLETPWQPVGTWLGIGSNPFIIKYQHPKPKNCSDGEKSTYILSVGMHKQRTCMPMMTTCTTRKNTYLVPSSVLPRWKNVRNCTFRVHNFGKAFNARKHSKSSNYCGKQLVNSYTPGISFNALNGEIIPVLYSDEYEFDANEYRKWHLEYTFNLDAAPCITDHKYESYSSKVKSFLDLCAKNLHNKLIWMFQPIELAKEFIVHYEVIRLQQIDAMMTLFCLPLELTQRVRIKNT